MHSLLMRQLDKYRHSEVIPSDWQNFISAVDDAYHEFDEERLLMERSLEISSQELLERNQELATLFENLQNAQTQLIKSEKMASLGQLIAGISHEINTPAGAIMAAIDQIREDYTDILEKMLHLSGKMSETLGKKYLSICEKVVNLNKILNITLTTTDIRKSAKEIEAIFEKENIVNFHQASKNLANIGITVNDVADLIPLLKSAESQAIQDALFKLGMSQIHVRDIKLAISRIAGLIKALKLYSQVNQGELTQANLKEQFENTFTILHHKLKNSIVIKKEFEDIPLLYCYAEQLNQVWVNLINNAIESLYEGGNIIVRLRKEKNEKILIEVEDNGLGIPDNIAHKIFETSFTTKQGGTGLGLSIAKDIVEHNKGQISFESKPGKTIFRVILPIEVKL